MLKAEKYFREMQPDDRGEELLSKDNDAFIA